MMLNDAGKMINNEWLKLPERFPNIKLHEYVTMPNHFHAILEIVGATLGICQHSCTFFLKKIKQQKSLFHPSRFTHKTLPPFILPLS